MIINLTNQNGLSCYPRRGVRAQVGNTMFGILATLLLASILSGMALPSIQRISANDRIESASVFNDQNGDSNPDPDEVLQTGTPKPTVATRSFGPAIIFRPGGATSLASDAVITNCNLRSPTTDRCMGITAPTPGIIESGGAGSVP